jgi:preprotein translocase subunit Sec63
MLTSEYSSYNVDANKRGIIATIPWATTGKPQFFSHTSHPLPRFQASSFRSDYVPGVAQLFVGGTLASLVGRLWALRISIFVMCIGV